MGLFDKKKNEEERSENEQEPKTEETAKTEDNQNAAVQPEGEKKDAPKTEEQIREEQAMKLNLTLYGDGQLAIQNGQNCTSRTQSMYMCFLALVKYLESDISLMTVQALINTIMKQKEGSNIIVPGARR